MPLPLRAAAAAAANLSPVLSAEARGSIEAVGTGSGWGKRRRGEGVRGEVENNKSLLITARKTAALLAIFLLIYNVQHTLTFHTATVKAHHKTVKKRNFGAG